jgi:hypothetical protein
MRQGDVLIIPVGKLPGNAQRAKVVGGRVVCQFGEVTGHAHAIKADEVISYTDTEETSTVVEALANGARAWLEVCLKASLTHEEHGAISLSPGIYEVRRQREYTPEQIRFVND